MAGPHVRDACARHLRDLDTGPERGLYYDRRAALRAIKFFRDVLHLNGGEYEGVPFRLLPWQCFIVGSLFGWKGPDGYRRFRIAYVETGKGSGKSPLAAGIGLLLLAADDEPRAEIYAAAAKKDQAEILFRDAVAMVEWSPELARRLTVGGGQSPNNIAYLATGSFFRPISSDDQGKGQSGPRPHGVLLDEIHEHPTDAMIEFMRAGTKNRRQALIFMITNSGSSRQTPCYAYHDFVAAVCRGDKVADTVFGYICAADENDDPFVDEACWIKTNPSLPSIPGYKYLREQVQEARGLPSKEAKVRRLNFCEWTDAENPLFSRDVWMAVQADLDLDAYKGRRCWAALDLSGKSDLTALAIAFETDDGLDIAVEYFTPADTVEEREQRDRSPYSLWIKDGFLTAVPGKSIRYEYVAQRLGDVAQDFDLQALAFDRARIEDFENALDDLGIEHHRAGDDGYGILMIDHGQGFIGMAPAIDALEERVLNGAVRIQRNPVTNMCAANAVVDTDPAENRKFNKRKATGRIDGMVVLAMVARIAANEIGEESSMYEAEGVFSVG